MGGACGHGDVSSSHRLNLRLLHREREGERRAFTNCAREPDLAAVQLDESLG